MPAGEHEGRDERGAHDDQRDRKPSHQVADGEAAREPIIARPRKKKTHDHEHEHGEQAVDGHAEKSFRFVLRMIAHEEDYAHHVAPSGSGQELVEKGANEEKLRSLAQWDFDMQHAQEKLPAKDSKELTDTGRRHGEPDPAPIRHFQRGSHHGASLRIVKEPQKQADGNRHLQQRERMTKQRGRRRAAIGLLPSRDRRKRDHPGMT